MTLVRDVARLYNPYDNRLDSEKWVAAPCLSAKFYREPWRRGQLRSCGHPTCEKDGDASLRAIASVIWTLLKTLKEKVT